VKGINELCATRHGRLIAGSIETGSFHPLLRCSNVGRFDPMRVPVERAVQMARLEEYRGGIRTGTAELTGILYQSAREYISTGVGCIELPFLLSSALGESRLGRRGTGSRPSERVHRQSLDAVPSRPYKTCGRRRESPLCLLGCCDPAQGRWRPIRPVNSSLTHSNCHALSSLWCCLLFLCRREIQNADPLAFLQSLQ
jgi:hypothetical protein